MDTVSTSAVYGLDLDARSQTLLHLPSDVWTHILHDLEAYSIIMLRATNKHLLKICRKFAKNKPDDEQTMQYFASIGSISCLKYCHELGIAWDEDTIMSASKNGQLETIKFLHNNGCDHNGSAIKAAANNNHLDCLKYMHENGFHWTKSTAAAATKTGNMEMLKYLHEHGCSLRDSVSLSTSQSIECLKYTIEHSSQDGRLRMSEWLCSSAASAGNLEALKYLHQAGYPLTRCCTRAAALGHLDCLKYAHEHGDDWDYTIMSAAHGGHTHCVKYAIENGDSLDSEPNRNYYSKPINAAARSGNIECVEYLIENGAQWPADVYQAALHSYHLPMVKYLLEVAHRPIPQTNAVCKAACGDVEILKYLHEHGFTWDEDTSTDRGDVSMVSGDQVVSSNTIAHYAVQCQNLPCLKYILSCGYKLDTKDMSLCFIAGIRNDIYMLQFLVGLGCEIHSSTMKEAVRYGSLETIKYLHKRGFELHDSLAVIAAQYKRHKVLEYFLKHGYGFNSMVCSAATMRRSIKCLRIAHKYGVPWTANTYLKATKKDMNLNQHLASRFKIMKFLHEHGCPWSHQECTLAAQHKDLTMLKYAHEHGSQWNSETWRTAVSNDALECLEYLLANGCPGPPTYSVKMKARCYEFMLQNNLIHVDAEEHKDSAESDEFKFKVVSRKRRYQ